MQATASDPVVGGDLHTVKSKRIQANVSLSGTVVPYKQVQLSAQMPGRVNFLAGQEGDQFKEGTLLATLSDDDLRAKLAQAEAGRSSAMAARQNSVVQLNKGVIDRDNSGQMGSMPGMAVPSMFDSMMANPMKNMSGQGSTGHDRYAKIHGLKTQLTAADGKVKMATSQIESIQTKFRDLKTIAPFDGVIVKKFAEVGKTMNPGMPLFLFADIRKLQIEVDIPARLMRGVQNQMIVAAKLDVDDDLIQAKVAQIYPMADQMRHTVKVKFDIPPNTSAAPGMYAEIHIPDAKSKIRDLPVIPMSAIKKRGGLPGVYVMNSENKPELRLLRIGANVGGGNVTVLSGLRAGERIVLKPAGAISSGWTK